MIEINVAELYAASGTAKLAQLPEYETQVLELAGEGQDVLLTGAGPIWLYLCLAHALHGKARSLSYSSPVTGEVEIYNHNPWEG